MGINFIVNFTFFCKIIRFIINYILNRISQETDIQIKSIRDDSSIGKHEVIFNFGKEEILVSHNALSRDIFGEGARLSIFLKSKNPSIYSMEDFLEEEN